MTVSSFFYMYIYVCTYIMTFRYKCSILICWVLYDLAFLVFKLKKNYILWKGLHYFSILFSVCCFLGYLVMRYAFLGQTKEDFFYKTHFMISVIWHVNLKIQAWKSFLVETLRFCFENFLIKTKVLLSTLLKINSRLFYHKQNFDVFWLPSYGCNWKYS